MITALKIILGLIVIFFVIPYWVYLLSKAISLGWERGKQTFRNYEQDPD